MKFSCLNFNHSFSLKLAFWLDWFGKIERTDELSYIVLVMLPDIILCEIKLETLVAVRVFEWLVILVDCKIHSIEELEVSKS